MATLKGSVSISGLPPNRGLVVNLGLISVSTADSEAPDEGEFAKESHPLHKVVDHVHLESESTRSAFVRRIRLELSPGYYYVQLRALLFRQHRGKMLCQPEQFHFRKRPIRVAEANEEEISFPVAWPETPIDQLGHIDTINPGPS